MSQPPRVYALSIKQPWAALVVHGQKTIEVRRWCTARRGRILVHAGRIPDQRPEAWSRITKDLRATTTLVGGVIGAVDVTDCRTYRSRGAFAADRAGHLNDPSWFEEPVLYGFVFGNPEVLAFRPLPGWVRFFAVD